LTKNTAESAKRDLYMQPGALKRLGL